MTDLSIVIVTWNARDVLLDALESIEREILGRQDEGRIEVETLVVDNGSEDGSVEAARGRFGWACVLALPENIGFAAGNNVGLARAKGRYSVLLNSDTVVLPDALEKCVRYLDAHPKVGVVGPQLLNPDLSKQNCIHNYPSLATELIPKGVLEKFFPRRFPSKRYEHAEPIPVEAVLGACLFVRREVLDQVGPMPEDYFFFLEETDWCYGIAAAGWEIMHIPDAHVIHIFGASTKKKIPAETRIEYHRSLYHFFRKNRGAARAAGIKALRITKALLYVAMRGPLALLSSSTRERWQQDWRVLRWHLRGCPDNEGLRAPRAAKQEGETA
ncbi:MAG: glycosyltransferase family 2 protein [bacterium]|nr:glycosyltransferase family 2 protein [bacterium]